MKSDVIIFAAGWRDELRWQVRSLHQYSPSTQVHLIYRGFDPSALGVHCVPSESLGMSEFEQFAATYVCKSPNPSAFELACWERHFSALTYAENIGLARYWMFDWDVLLFSDLSEETEKYFEFRYGREQAHFFINDLKLVSSWLRWCRSHDWVKQPPPYVTSNSEQVMERVYFDDPARQGQTVQLTNAAQDGAFNDNIATPGWNGYAFADGVVTLEWRDSGRPGLKYPYAFHPASQTWIRQKSLHCWGAHKQRMAEHLRKGTG